MLVSDLRRALADIPDGAWVFLTWPDDECSPGVITYDAANRIFRLCKSVDDVGKTERVLEDYTVASGQFGVGA
jgi:hypothetical protein